MISREPYIDCIRHIERQQELLTRHYLKDAGIYIGLPYHFISPNNDIYRDDQFYWDTYFIILALVVSQHAQLAKGMVGNLLYLFKRFGIIPMRNRFFNLGISQPPFLTSMIEEVYTATHDRQWRRQATLVAEEELRTYWMDERRAERHLVFRGLSRYVDHYILHQTAEQESGWDTTSRFGDHTLDILPVDLNACLYKYEKDLAHFYKEAGELARSQHYDKKAKARKKAMSELMWNGAKGFFFDYNYERGEQIGFYSLAGFYPLWAKMVSRERALHIVKRLPIFEYEWGLANTQKEGLFEPFRQHDYPNGWPQQHWIVIKGLLNYGFVEQAERIAQKWLDGNKKVFTATGLFWEKYDVVEGAVGRPDRYPTQNGFGWTNAVFMRLLWEFSSERLQEHPRNLIEKVLDGSSKNFLELLRTVGGGK
jgi:alpha,alpha-trehalase